MLLTQELKDRFIKIWTQEDEADPIIVAKFFHPYSNRYRFAISYDDTEQLFFGRVKWDYPELWYFNLQEMQSINIMWLPLERDRYRIEKPLSEVIKEYDK
jgi:hypothetical protein